MNSIDFCFWLQGHFEMSESKPLSQTQTDIIRNHLNLVFKHEIDPLREGETETSVKVLNEAHSGKKPAFHRPQTDNDMLMRC